MEKEVCPKCGSKNTVPIMYGHPTNEGFERAKRGEFALGGCIVMDSNPGWMCRDCDNEFGAMIEWEDWYKE